jgi:hypothetical protein
MELSRFGRIGAFVVIVMVLAGMAVYFFLPQPSAAGSKPFRSPAASPSAAPSPSSSAAASGLADIYQWVPFTQAGLSAAAQLTIEFARDYGTYTYSQSTASYLAPMRPLASGELVQVIGRAFAAPGVAGSRAAGKQVVTDTASIVSLRAFGQTSLTFVVDLTEHISATKGRSQQTTAYAVTVTGTGTSWQVSDIELASAGNG